VTSCQSADLNISLYIIIIIVYERQMLVYLSDILSARSPHETFVINKTAVVHKVLTNELISES